LVTVDKIGETLLQQYNVISQPYFWPVSRICITMFTYVSLHTAILTQPRPTRMSDRARSITVGATGVRLDYFDGFGS